MAYNEGLAERLREQLAKRRGVGEKRMFGGLCFLLHGNMVVGIAGDALMVRVGPDAHDAALARPHARPMDFTGRPMKGYVFVDPPGFDSERDLAAWVERAVRFVSRLPRK